MSLPLSSHSKARDEEIEYGEERGRDRDIQVFATERS
jgi:hypothetical protein